MFTGGEIGLTLVLAVLAASGWVVAVIGLSLAMARRDRSAATAEQAADMPSTETPLDVRLIRIVDAGAGRAVPPPTKTQDAEHRPTELGPLAGALAQDFGALLGVMTSALDRMVVHADDPERVRRLGEAALRAGRKGEALTRRMAALAEADPTARSLQDVGVLIRSLEARLRALAQPGVDLSLSVTDKPAQATVDPVALEGAVNALVVNALEAVRGGVPRTVVVRLDTEADTVRLSVRDTGHGMEADVAQRATEAFFTTREGSAGLGLVQAQAFARQSGGTLSLHTAPGQGCEVIITLPRATDAEEAATDPKS